MSTAAEGAMTEAVIRVKTPPMGRTPTCKKKYYDTLIFFFYFGIAKQEIAEQNSKFGVKFLQHKRGRTATNTLFGAGRK